jgi:hypothetical protein
VASPIGVPEIFALELEGWGAPMPGNLPQGETASAFVSPIWRTMPERMT